MRMSKHILFSYALSGPRRGERLQGRDVAALLLSDDLAWAHLDALDLGAGDWIQRNLPYLDPHAVDALLAEETRPRATPIGDGFLVILRGVNLNEGADPEDMVSIRLWVDPHRIVSLQRRPLRAVADVAARIDEGAGPESSGAFLALLVERLTHRMEPLLRQLDDEADALEEDVIDEASPALRRPITEVRRRAITFRRYIAPQRDAVATLRTQTPSFLDDMDRRRLSESQDRLLRTIEDLDAIRERAQIVKDELGAALSDRQNRHLYFLAIVSAIFLPLGFLTGLMGINLGGMPGADSAFGFWIFTGALGVVTGVTALLLRRLRVV